ncbi:MAG: tRNA lysidine(34) synthetase TilS [Clostridia bacterium]|nr:tRNA lysidine(34) synthetase TilS [Clostridia bacterium]
MKPHPFETKLLAFSRQYGLFPNTSRVLVGASGGADSQALLMALTRLASLLHLEVGAAHLNHGIRGDEALRDLETVRAFCRARQIPFYEGHADCPALAAKQAVGLEEAARQARYAFLERVRLERGYSLIAVAHHADDQLETLLFHLIRGSGTGGMAGMAPQNGRVVRPLLTHTREEIEAYAAELHIPFVTDSTNADPAYTRNRLRSEVTPVLRQLNPAAAVHSTQCALHLRRDEEFLTELASAEALRLGKEPSVAELAALPEALRMRVLRLWAGPSADGAHLRALDSLVAQARPHSRVTLPCGEEAAVENGKLVRRVRINVSPLEEVPLVQNGTVRFGDFCLRTQVLEGECEKIYNLFIQNKTPCGTMDNGAWRLCLDGQALCGPVTVRAPRRGDRVKLCSRPEKALSDVFQQGGVPLEARSGVPVFCDGQGIVAVAGFGPCQRVACRPEMTQMYLIEINKIGEEYYGESEIE